MLNVPACPLCSMENTYPDEDYYICPDCAHEWLILDSEEEHNDLLNARDANGNPLSDGDSVILIKDLKVKGSSLVLKKGTKVKSIRIIEGDHNIDCKVDNTALQLKSKFLKKA